MKTDRPPPSARPAPGDNRVAQRHHKQSQAAQLSTANGEESPRMDRGSEGGAGESMEHGRAGETGAGATRRDDVDEQYGTRSTMKAPPRGRTASGGSGPGRPLDPAAADESVPNPGSSEESAGTERDTMTPSRPGPRRGRNG